MGPAQSVRGNWAPNSVLVSRRAAGAVSGRTEYYPVGERRLKEFNKRRGWAESRSRAASLNSRLTRSGEGAVRRSEGRKLGSDEERSGSNSFAEKLAPLSSTL